MWSQNNCIWQQVIECNYPWCVRKSKAYHGGLTCLCCHIKTSSIITRSVRAATSYGLKCQLFCLSNWEVSKMTKKLIFQNILEPWMILKLSTQCVQICNLQTSNTWMLWWMYLGVSWINMVFHDKIPGENSLKTFQRLPYIRVWKNVCSYFMDQIGNCCT